LLRKKNKMEIQANKDVGLERKVEDKEFYQKRFMESLNLYERKPLMRD